MMNDGRPLFVQQDPLEETPDGSPVDDSSAAVPVQPREPVDPIGNRLKFSTDYATEPVCHLQARLYPDSVKVVGESYKVFDVHKPEDMQRYSDIRMSHYSYGRYILTSEENLQWNESKGTWLVLVRVQERVFKTFSTASTTPPQ